MAIFLILVLMLLVIIFHLTHNSKFKELHNHLDHLQKQLNEALKQSRVVVTEKKEETVTVKPVIIPEKKVEPPVIKEEKIIEKKEEIIPPPPIVEKKEEKKPEIVDIPVIQNPQPRINKPVEEPQLSWYDKFKERNPDLEKFIGENLLSKIAITILVLGIAFFVKYAIDQDWIKPPGRVGIGVLCGSILLGFAHKLRLKFKPFSSVLVAGGIAVFYFTIAIGFHEYQLFSQTVAFAMMLVITAFSVFISVAYDRVELAALSIVGGFAVPFMVSTGAGNYQVLFTYILILDIGMLVLAYLKKWNLINILAYVFTIILYSAWLGTKVFYAPVPPYAGAFLFGLIFYMVFVLMNVVNNIKEKRPFSYAELIILISNTFVFYISGMLILREWHWEFKGIYTVAMGSVNFILAVALYKYFKADKKLVYLLIGLTLTFATLAAPVQLKGNYITLFWGAEAAMLIWLSLRSQLKAFKLASMIVASLMCMSLLMDFGKIYADHHQDFLDTLTNKGFITGIASALFLFAGAFILSRDKGSDGEGADPDSKTYANVLKIASVSIAYITGFLEIYHQSSYLSSLGYFSGSSVAAMSCFYHVVFTSVVGMILLKKFSLSNNTISFILLSVNLVYFTGIFSTVPYHELLERCRTEHGSSIGYQLHFVTLLAMAAHLIYTIRKAIATNNFIIAAKTSLLWIFGIFVIIIVTNEVMLNTLILKMSGFTRVNAYDIVQLIYDETRVQVVKIALPVTWGIIAFTFLNIGIRKQLKSLRIMALVLLAITIIKLFTYDINNVSEAGKIIAFIILGVVLLIMSFMYQKIKALILSEEPETTNQTNPNNETKPD